MESMEEERDESVEDMETSFSDARQIPTLLQEKIIQLVELYFGDDHFPFNPFLKNQMESGTWISIDSLLKHYTIFEKLTTNPAVIVEALKWSKSGMIEVSACETKIRRPLKIKPLPIFDRHWFSERNRRTVYCKGFPKGGMHPDMFWNFFLQIPTLVVNVEMNFCMVSVNEPLQKPQVEIFNGSVRVVFSSRQEAENFMTIENVTYNDSTIIRMWQSEWEIEKPECFCTQRYYKEINLFLEKEKGNQLLDTGNVIMNGHEQEPNKSLMMGCESDGVGLKRSLRLARKRIAQATKCGLEANSISDDGVTPAKKAKRH